MLLTIPPAESLADRLALWLWDQYGEQPEALSRILIFLPTTRAVRTLKEAFLRGVEGKALLLPQMLPINEIDEKLILRHAQPSLTQLEQIHAMPVVPSSLERLMQLQELVWAYGRKTIPRLHDREAAMDLAVNLADFMDEMDREQCDWTKLDRLVPEDYAQHWQQTLQFLQIIRDYWPQLEKEQGWQRPWQKRNRLIEILIECWQASPPEFPVIAAGTTGSVPATAALLKAIHTQPKGAIFLPGFDRKLQSEELPPTHPQATMRELLERLDRSHEEVEELSDSHIPHLLRNLDPSEEDSATSAECGKQRGYWINQAMLPVDQQQEMMAPLAMDTALEKVHLLTAQNDHELAFSSALLMREALEKPNQTAAFITPDRAMARAVATQLQRWEITVDDSAGKPLTSTPPALFMQLLLDAVRYGLKPVSLLALMKHPLCCAGYAAGEVRQKIRQLEKSNWRGLAFPHWQKMKAEAGDNLPILEAMEQHLQPLLDAFASEKDVSFIELIDIWLNAAQVLATDEAGICHLWQGEGAKELSGFFAELKQLSAAPLISAEELPGMFRALIRGQVVRPRYGIHPRLQIVSPMEARMQRYDRVILANLNEGCWPQRTDADPWMNRQMRAQLGLPSPDKRIGQQAHDFVQQMAGGEVFMLRTEKSGGAETVPSRFVQRLQLVAEMNEAGLGWQNHPVSQWRENLLHPPAMPPATRPAPNPPLEARPRQLSVTSIERLMQDPYSIYAQKILRLKKLDELEPEPSHREFGNLLHDILEQHFTTGEVLLDCAKQQLQAADLGYVADSLWWPRMERIAEWVGQQPLSPQMHCEMQGQWKFASAGGEFTLTARVDRLEESAAGFAIIDYKTGAPPYAEWMRQGMASQLSLAAAIAQRGGFGGHLAGKSVESLEYWKLGGKKGGERVPFAIEKDQSLEEAVSQAAEALPKIIAAYDKPDKPYEAIPEYRFKPRYNDYEHLARMQEWLD